MEINNNLVKQKKLQKLAQKLQLEVKKEELPIYLETFNQLENLLANFNKAKIGKRVKSMKRIDVGYLTLSDLEKIKKKFAKKRVNKKTLKNNAEITPDGFVLFRREIT